MEEESKNNKKESVASLMKTTAHLLSNISDELQLDDDLVDAVEEEDVDKIR